MIFCDANRCYISRFRQALYHSQDLILECSCYRVHDRLMEISSSLLSRHGSSRDLCHVGLRNLKLWLNAMFILNFLVPVPHFVVREFELNPGDGWEDPGLWVSMFRPKRGWRSEQVGKNTPHMGRKGEKFRQGR